MQESQHQHYVIYTDLDGSLLDHHTYSHEPANPLLGTLENKGIPVVFTSSKTASEVITLKESLQNNHPFIIENGAAVYIPKDNFQIQPKDTIKLKHWWVKRFSFPREHWVSQLNSISRDYGGLYRSFSQLEISDIMALTGLDRRSAIQAADRQYGEPVVWSGSEAQKEKFVQALQSKGCHVLQGGRFLHVSGDCDKGKALRWLHNLYCEYWSDKRTASLAIGDSQNDIAMLCASTYALIIRSPAHEPPKLSCNKQAIISQAYGPLGWVECVRQIIPI